MPQDAAIPSRSQGPETLSRLLSRLEEAPEGRDVTIGALLAALEGRSLGAVVAALGLFASIPVIGALPGVSVGVGLLTLAVIVHSVIGRGSGLWLPGWLRRRSIGAGTYRDGLEKARPVAERVDRHMRPRLTWLTRGLPAAAALRLACALLALTMIPLAAVPWGVTPPAAGLVALGLAMMTRDGLAAAIGYALAALTLIAMAALT